MKKISTLMKVLKDLSNCLRGNGAVRSRAHSMFAFTLAEVLITLAIIGVVAAMTIPTLISQYKEKVTVTKVKKMYSTLVQGYQLYLANGGKARGFEQSPEGAQKFYDEVIAPYFKVTKYCTAGEEGCMYNGYYQKKNGNYEGTRYIDSPYGASILLNDGSSIWYIIFEDGHVSIYYDTTGPAGPNKWANDVFNFNIVGQKLYACGDPYYDQIFIPKCSTIDSDGRGCTAWVIYKGNMDYLKCDGLTWDDMKCPD